MLRAVWVSLYRRLSPIAAFFLFGLVALSVSRLGLALWHAARVSAADGWGTVFLQGVRVDVATLCLLYGIPAVLALLLPVDGRLGRAWRHLLRGWLIAASVLLVFMELATPSFMAEYGLRPNRLFLEYLIYPEEVGMTLLRGHLLAVVIEVTAVIVLFWVLLRGSRRWVVPTPTVPVEAGWLWRLPLALLVLLLAAMGVRSSLGHRPLNPALVAFSTDPTINALPLNSLYTVGFAARQLATRSETSRVYGDLPLAEVVSELRATSGLPASAYVSDDLPSLALRPPMHTGTPRNLVIVLEESLGAQFIGSLGGRPLSPNYDRLSAQGWAFERLYATGTRSVRGIEAVLTGFPPTPAESVVKLPPSRQRFFTLADVLGRHGYDTGFYYGGESHFDNMREFFLANGFTRIVDRKDYRKPAFVGSWGASDEDLFGRADQQFRELNAQGKPFFGLVFTSSNHDPFEFPDGRIDLYEQPKQTRDNAAKYADYALGEFFRKAMASPYWENTVFLVVADHDSRVFGKDMVPIANFHIPGLILGGGIAPRRDARIVSQIDLPPTLLSLLGIADPTPLVGQDLTDARRLQPGRALMQYDRNLAWMEGNEVAILQPDKPAQGYRYDPASDQLQPQPLNPALARRAHAYAMWGTLAYEKELYRLPEKAKPTPRP